MGKLIAVVKGGPISNDATIEDANFVQLSAVVDSVLTTGSADLGVHPERSSIEFRTLLRDADLVIAKGQSNLESLWDNKHLRTGKTAFLLVAKCQVIAESLEVPRMSPIILLA